MKTKGFKIIGFALLAVAAVGGFSLAVMLLWNAIIPGIFGLGIISWCQALGLLVLSRILFGGFGHGMGRRCGGMHYKNAIREKWMNMTPEERKEFVKRRKENRCGGPFGRRGFWSDRDFDKKDNE